MLTTRKIAATTLFMLIMMVAIKAQKRPMTTDDGLNLERLSRALLHPDGELVIYGKSELNWKKNKRETKYFAVTADGETTHQYLGKQGGSDLKFSPRGTYLTLKRKVDDFQQLFIMRTTGGEAVQLTKHKSSIGQYEWSADEQFIYFIANTAVSKEDKKNKKDGYDAYFVDEGPNGQREGQWNNIWQFKVADKTEKQMTSGQHILRNLAVHPSGQQLAFTRRTENRRNQSNHSELYLFTVVDSTMVQLTDNRAPESGLKWSPDGSRLAYLAPDDQEWLLKNNKIWTIDPASKSHHVVSGSFEGNIRNYFWGKDQNSIFFAGLQKTESNLFRLNLVEGKYTAITQGGGNTSLLGFDRKHSKVLFSKGNHQTPGDLYVSPATKISPTKLTNLNPILTDSLQLGTMKVVSWKSKDGLEIEGLLWLPPSYDATKKYPLLLHIHGGPAGVFTNSFRSQYHVWAGLGYVQLCPNVRGSSGYSDALLQGNQQDIGGMDYEDLMTGVDHLIAEGLVDPERMAVRGWSYGGILGGTTITKTSRFKAASLGAMVSDWTSEYGIGFNFDVRLWYIGGTPWENPEGYRSKSPLTHAAKVTTPTLLMHGLSDYVDTEAQSMMFFAALKDMGKEVRYLRFPREPHGFREPRHQRTRDIEEIQWIQKHTLGLDWKPWKRATVKDSE